MSAARCATALAIVSCVSAVGACGGNEGTNAGDVDAIAEADVAHDSSSVEDTLDAFDAAADATSEASEDGATDDTPLDVSSPCDAGATLCSGACVDLRSDPNNCGACGKNCSCPGTLCTGGGCALECPAGDTACTDPATGCPRCVNLATDSANCGACGHACPSGKYCVSGTCA